MLEAELAFAHEVADRAAEIGLRHFGGRMATRLKPDRTPVTEADLAIEAMVREALRSAFPGDAVVGEEEGGELDPGRTWIVDPIDETKNFAVGIQVWGTLIALAERGRMVLGVVGAPALGERYEAVTGAGARRNGEPIRASDAATVSDALVVHSGLEEFLRPPLDTRFRRLVFDARRTRGFGGFWGHMLVARGAAEIMLEPELALWDWAAPSVIVEEAGGRMTAFDGGALRHGGSVVTTNGILHEEVVARLRG